MVKVKYRDLSVSRRILVKLKEVFKSRLFKVAISLFVIGIAMIVASYIVQGTYYYHNDSTQQVALSSITPQVVNVSQLVGSPLNVTFLMPQHQSLHYRIYTVLTIQLKGVITTFITNVTSGTAVNGTLATVKTVYSPQYYHVELITTSNVSYNVTVNAAQEVPQHIPSNLYLGFPGASIMVIGTIALAFSITRGFK